MQNSDFLVIGSGIAGLIYSLDVAACGSVTVLCKREPDEGNTRYAQGGIASVIDPLDSFEAHIADTLEAGAGLCHKKVVELVVREGPERIRQLSSLGTRFDTAGESEEFELAQEGGHSARRILHARDQTGAEIQRAVYAQAAAHPRITILPHHVAVDLILNDLDGRREVLGAYALDATSGKVIAFGAKLTMLATGGAGKVYLYTSNPDVATGDGVAIAIRAGADVGSMEFFQFHPTCLFHPQAKSFLVTEAMRGEGAKLRTVRGEEFLQLYHPDRELAPRDIVARAIDDQMKKSGDDCVLLDISHRPAEFIRSRFPTVYERTKSFGFDLTKGPIPVVPAAHYCCGGVVTDEWARASLDRLYAAGEVAFTGLHGANRLASNSLLEAIVFAHRAALDSIRRVRTLELPSRIKEWDYLDTVHSPEEVVVSHMWDEVRRLMWNLVGIVRSDHRLELAKRRIALIKQETRDYYWRFRVTSNLIELRNIIEVAEAIIRCAAGRRESRGLHYNVDCPERDDARWQLDIVLRGGKTVESVPIKRS